VVGGEMTMKLEAEQQDDAPAALSPIGKVPSGATMEELRFGDLVGGTTTATRPCQHPVSRRHRIGR
jgi:hypothetical protein